MCGRYASVKSPTDLADEFRAVDATDGTVEPDYNVAPTKTIVAVVERHPRDADGNPDPATTERTLRTLTWGLVPSWSKDAKGGARMINARSESVTTKPAYRRAVESRRCLVPADGWYEWQRNPPGSKGDDPYRAQRNPPGSKGDDPHRAQRNPPGSKGDDPHRAQRGRDHKQPYYTHYADGSSLALAGIWEYWKPQHDPEDEYPQGLVTVSVLTTSAVGLLAQVHDRMPLVLPGSAWDAWLDPDAGSADVAELLAPPSAELVAGLELRPVSPLVNSVRNNGPELLAPMAPEDVAEPLQLDLLAGPNPE